jgi:hypothetical protein
MTVNGTQLGVISPVRFTRDRSKRLEAEVRK